MDTNVQKTLFSSGKDDWETPDDLFNRLNSIYHFVLDAAADATNHKCPVWFGPESPIGVVDALDETAPWWEWLDRGNIWLNPPYSRGLQKRFVDRASYESIIHRNKKNTFSNHVICLLPARTDTALFHDKVRPYATKYEFLRGRLKFKGAKHGAPFPSMVVVF